MQSAAKYCAEACAVSSKTHFNLSIYVISVPNFEIISRASFDYGINRGKNEKYFGILRTERKLA